jgi:hypothetical protein
MKNSTQEFNLKTCPNSNPNINFGLDPKGTPKRAICAPLHLEKAQEKYDPQGATKGPISAFFY